MGPVWQGGNAGEPEILANAYRNSLRLALDEGSRTIAFPSISTGAYGYPLDLAARVAIRTIRSFCREFPGLEEVRMILFGRKALMAYEEALKEISAEKQ